MGEDIDRGVKNHIYDDIPPTIPMFLPHYLSKPLIKTEGAEAKIFTKT